MAQWFARLFLDQDGMGSITVTVFQCHCYFSVTIKNGEMTKKTGHSLSKIGTRVGFAQRINETLFCLKFCFFPVGQFNQFFNDQERLRLASILVGIVMFWLCMFKRF